MNTILLPLGRKKWPPIPTGATVLNTYHYWNFCTSTCKCTVFLVPICYMSWSADGKNVIKIKLKLRKWVLEKKSFQLSFERREWAGYVAWLRGDDRKLICRHYSKLQNFNCIQQIPISSTSTSTSIYWHSCGLKAEQPDKTRKGLKTCKQHNKPKWTQHNKAKPKWREGSNPLAVTIWPTRCNQMDSNLANLDAIVKVE